MDIRAKALNLVAGIVAASYKKKISYNYKLKISNRGEIKNANCECPSGQGPAGSCKHIVAVALMLCHFKEKGEILVKQSGTERLQVFHHPQSKHTGTMILDFFCA